MWFGFTFALGAVLALICLYALFFVCGMAFAILRAVLQSLTTVRGWIALCSSLLFAGWVLHLVLMAANH